MNAENQKQSIDTGLGARHGLETIHLVDAFGRDLFMTFNPDSADYQKLLSGEEVMIWTMDEHLDHEEITVKMK